MSSELRFIADAMLGKLARWLRIMGYDTLYFRGRDKRELIRMAKAEERVLLSRDTRLLSRKKLPPNLFIRSDYPKEQLKEVSRRYNLSPGDKSLSLCSCCNVPIKRISKAHVEGEVPEYIYVQHTKFSQCPRCKRIFWQGSHYKTMIEGLAGLTGDDAREG